MALSFIFRLIALCLLLHKFVVCFVPTTCIGEWCVPVSSQTHRKITEEAIKIVAKKLMTNYGEEYYPNPSESLNSESFKEARRQFLTAVVMPDEKRDHEKHAVEAHFDNESFASGVDRLIEYRLVAVSGTKNATTASLTIARERAGRAMHGLQDFYSHSNWIELGNRQPYPELWQRRIPEVQVAKKDQATCVDCRESDGEIIATGRCEQENIIASIFTNRLLTSGYPSTTSAECGTSVVAPSTRIVGGEEATPHSWPWQCRLVADLHNGLFTRCGASVVNKYYLLTAAHCIFSNGTRILDDWFTVYCGDHDRSITELSEKKFVAPIITVHASYNGISYMNDIAVVKLPTPLELDDYIKPVCLPTADVSVGTTCVVTGWGLTNSTASDNVLRQVSLSVLPAASCTNVFPTFDGTTMLCTGFPAGGKGSCFGDSGGPFVCLVGGRWELHGIVSYGKRGVCGRGNSPTSYSRVTAFLPWIEENTGAKCRHGGWLIDDARDSPPTGGINKDSDWDTFSPHSYLHQNAADVARESTVQFLESIRLAVWNPDFQVIPDERFAEFLGIPVGSATTLCFVVDTTGSMSEEIAAVRDVTIRITSEASASDGSLKPSDYVLVPFNDPSYGPLFKTANATTMIATLRRLRADGGGDEPELAFHGLELAINNVRGGSTCYMFTDAPAKDYYLYPVVLSSCLKKKIQIILIYTGSSYKRRKRSASRRSRRATYSYYDDLVRLTGGSVFSVTNANIGQAVDVVKNGASGLKVTVFTADNIVGGFSFYVDQSMTAVFVQISDSFSYLSFTTFTSPDGLSYANYTTELNLPSLKLYNMSTLQPGLWRANVSTRYRYPFSVLVTATSIVSFTYQFATFGADIHPGYFPLTSNPIAGTPYYIVVDLFGAFDPATDLWIDTVSNITEIMFVNQNGTVMNRFAANELQSYKQFMAMSVLPTTGFRVAIEGVDAAGNVLRRFDQSVVSAVVIKLDIKITGNGSFSLLPGQSVNVSVNVTNVGATASWYIRISDTAGFYRGSTPIVVALNTSQSQTMFMRFQAPPDESSVGTVSTATISAGTSSASSVENYEIFYMNVKSAYVDNDPPSCVVDRVDGVCSGDRPTSVSEECRRSVWSVAFQVQDVGSGLESVSVRATHNYSLHVDPFDRSSNATVNGTYEATCCDPSVTINALDLYGNIGSCFVFNDQTPPTCAEVASEGACRPAYTSAENACENDIWQTTLVVFDAGSGLKQVTADSNSTNYRLDTTAVVHGSVARTNVTFRSSCCYQTAVISVYDVSNNNASCTVAASTKYADGDAPYCGFDDIRGFCAGGRPTSATSECQRIVWTARFHARSVNSGLRSVSVKPLLTTYNYSLHMDHLDGTNGATVYGTYKASCCYPNVTINVVDSSGHVGSCFKYNDLTPPTCTPIVTFSNCKPHYNSSNITGSGCGDDTWKSSLYVQDTASGLQRLTVSTNSTNYTLDPTTFPRGSIVSTRVTYKSSCCYQTADITVYDVSNNVATCKVAAVQAATDHPKAKSAAVAAAAAAALFITITALHVVASLSCIVN